MKVSEVVLRYLAENGVKHIYGIPSGTVGQLADAFNEVKEIKYIVTKNEAAASFSACKYAKVSQKLGVCLMSGSVGIANAMNGIAEAAQSNAPILILCGYINQKQMGMGLIQDLESVKLLKGVIKHTVRIYNEKYMLRELKKAMEIAMTHPRGPVNVEIPINIQKDEFTGVYIPYEEPRKLMPDYNNLEKAVNLINNVQKGLIFIGSSCRGLGENIKALAEKLNWRMVTTHGAKGVVEEDFRLHMGHYGFPGTDLAIDYINNGDYDCVLVLGSALGEAATYGFNANLGKHKLIHVHLDKNVFYRAYNADIALQEDIGLVLNYLIEHVNPKFFDNDVKDPLNKPYVKNHTGMSLRLLYENVHKYLPQDTFYVNDLGETLAYVHKYLVIPKGGDYECNLNYGCMGSSVGALGISRIDPNRQIAVFVGDGSFYMNILSELLTAMKYNMKIIFFVINNSSLSYVNRGQTLAFGRSLKEFSDPYVDIARIVQAMGIPAMKIKEFEDMKNLRDFYQNINGPQVVEVITDSSEPIPLNRGNNVK